jgi:fatty acid desaturase
MPEGGEHGSDFLAACVSPMAPPPEPFLAAVPPLKPFSPFARLLNDERDLPFIRLMVRATLWLVPAVALLFLHYRWWMTPLYLAVTLGYFFPPFTLMLHCSSHRQLFRKELAWMNELIPWVYSPFFGQTPCTYAAHHMGMHHPENNLWDDDSSTLPYQRDNLLHFLNYFGRFMLVGLKHLQAYLRRTRRTRLERRARAGELLFWSATLVLTWLHPAATLTVLVAPLLIARFAMMCGNWAQHAFVVASDPNNPYRNSITCIESFYNDRCFNDGYHIGHHIQPKLHWTEMRGDFEKNRAHYRDQGAIVFRRIDYFVIWALLMTHSYKTLARHFVDLQEPRRSEQEIIQLLRERLGPVSRPVAQSQTMKTAA